MNFEVAGTGMYVPEKVVTNDELSQFLDTSDEWISQRVGVRERHICTDETAVDLAYHAAVNALKNSGCEPDELDLILGATVSNETVCPNLACMVQQKLGATCTAFDINAACSSFLYLLETAAGFFARGNVKKVLIIGAERMSRIVDWRDRSTCVIVGDGAGAAVLREGDGYLSSVITVKGGDSVIKVPQLIGNSPFFKLKQENPYMYMNGQETFKYAVNAICGDVEAILEKTKLSMDDIAYIVPHQANKRILDLVARRLDIPIGKFYINIERYGNTSAASIPIALDEMNRVGLIQRGDYLLLTAFGGGLSNAACVLKW